MYDFQRNKIHPGIFLRVGLVHFDPKSLRSTCPEIPAKYYSSDQSCSSHCWASAQRQWPASHCNARRSLNHHYFPIPNSNLMLLHFYAMKMSSLGKVGESFWSRYNSNELQIILKKNCQINGRIITNSFGSSSKLTTNIWCLWTAPSPRKYRCKAFEYTKYLSSSISSTEPTGSPPPENCTYIVFCYLTIK